MAREFNNNNSDYLSGSTPVTGPPFTISCWIRPDTVNLDHGLVAIGVGLQNEHRWQLYINDTDLGLRWFAFDTAANGIAVSTADLTAGAWAHAAAIEYANNSRAVFTNGADKQTNSTTVNITGATTLYVGNNMLRDSRHDGGIAEVAVWSAALSDSEIAALGRGVNPSSIRPSSLASYWPLLGLDSPEPDWSGNGGNLTVNGAVVYSTHSPTQSWLPSKSSLFAPPVPASYTQTKFRLYQNNGVGLGEAA